MSTNRSAAHSVPRDSHHVVGCSALIKAEPIRIEKKTFSIGESCPLLLLVQAFKRASFKIYSAGNDCGGGRWIYLPLTGQPLQRSRVSDIGSCLSWGPIGVRINFLLLFRERERNKKRMGVFTNIKDENCAAEKAISMTRMSLMEEKDL